MYGKDILNHYNIQLDVITLTLLFGIYPFPAIDSLLVTIIIYQLLTIYQIVLYMCPNGNFVYIVKTFGALKVGRWYVLFLNV